MGKEGWEECYKLGLKVEDVLNLGIVCGHLFESDAYLSFCHRVLFTALNICAAVNGCFWAWWGLCPRCGIYNFSNYFNKVGDFTGMLLVTKNNLELHFTFILNVGISSIHLLGAWRFFEFLKYEKVNKDLSKLVQQ